MQHIGASTAMQAYSTLYDECKVLPLDEGRILMRTVQDLVQDPWCYINTTYIMSVRILDCASSCLCGSSASTPNHTQIDAANAPCITDESDYCERTVASGLYSCDVDYCSVSVECHLLAQAPHRPPYFKLIPNTVPYVPL
jgi:hypothetical protein